MSPRVVLTAISSALIILLLAGCGLEGQPFSTATDQTDSTAADAGEFNPSVVTAEAIAAYPKNSPEAATLEWWRAVQTRDPDAVLEAYTSEARDALPRKFPMALVTGISPPAATSAIKVADVESDGDDKATVYVVIQSGDPRMNGPLALPMQKVDDRWEITDPIFLGSLADVYITAARVAEQSAEDSGQ